MKLEVLTEYAVYVSCDLTEEAATGFLNELHYGTGRAIKFPEANGDVDTRIMRGFVIAASAMPDDQPEES